MMCCHEPIAWGVVNMRIVIQLLPMCDVYQLYDKGMFPDLQGDVSDNGILGNGEVHCEYFSSKNYPSLANEDLNTSKILR